MHVPVGHSFPDATAVAFALGLGPPSLLAAIHYYSFPNLEFGFQIILLERNLKPNRSLEFIGYFEFSRHI